VASILKCLELSREYPKLVIALCWLRCLMTIFQGLLFIPSAVPQLNDIYEVKKFMTNMQDDSIIVLEMVVKKIIQNPTVVRIIVVLV
jgi:hypothetical protein